MTLLKPQLSIRRLAIFYKGSPVYNEVFKDGVNIVRGSNSSGKSTIADFIFYVLGGDLKEWKPESERCDYVMAEIEINEAFITFKRSVADSKMQPMSIFWGPFEKARQSAAEGWQVYPFQRSAKKESFSQVLFRAFGFPEVKSDLGNNITMHQILRLLYVDQLSSVQSLMRDEMFDSALTRRTVGDLLFGIYDDSLYKDELRYRETQKELDSASSQFESILQILGESDQEVEFDKIKKEIEETELQLQKIIQALKEGQEDSEETKSLEGFSVIQNELLQLRQELAARTKEAKDLELEIEDSRQFIVSLGRRISYLDESIATRDILGELPVTRCPECLSPLKKELAEGVCPLCKENIPKDSGKTQALRMREELILQIKESQNLLAEREKEFARIMKILPGLAEQTKLKETYFDESVSRIRTKRNTHIDSLNVKRGSLESKLLFLHKQAKAVGYLEQVRKRKERLSAEVKELENSIKIKKSKQQIRLMETKARIQEIALFLLKRDLPREETFQNANEIEVDFSKNTFGVNGRNQFSASSITYLKNCIHYAICFASLLLDYFRYPRFIICDNMEDKGMEEIRSQNFQRAIVEMAKRIGADIRYQIIFTTSMIDPSLDNTELCVGPKYSQTRKVLNFGL